MPHWIKQYAYTEIGSEFCLAKWKDTALGGSKDEILLKISSEGKEGCSCCEMNVFFNRLHVIPADNVLKELFALHWGDSALH